MKRIAAVTVLALVAGSAFAQTVTRAGADRVTVRAKGIPVSRLLEELAAVQPLNIVFTDEQVKNAPVSIQVENLTVDQAVRRVLLEAEVDCAVGGLAGEPLQVFVGKAGSARKPGSDHAQPGPDALAANDGKPPVTEKVEASPEPETADATPAGDERTAGDDKFESPATPGMPGFSMVGESVTYHDPNFVPFKNTEVARRARMAVDVSTIP